MINDLSPIDWVMSENCTLQMASTWVNGVYTVTCATAEGQSCFRRYHEHGLSQHTPYSRRTIRQVSLVTTEYCGRINYFDVIFFRLGR